MTMRREEKTQRERLRDEYYETKDLEPHQRKPLNGGPQIYPTGRRCECDEPLSIYNAGPGCRKCNAEDTKNEESLLWAIRFGDVGTIF